MKKRDLLLLILSLTLLVFGAVQLSLHFANRQAGLEKEDELRRIWRAEDATEIVFLYGVGNLAADTNSAWLY